MIRIRILQLRPRSRIGLPCLKRFMKNPKSPAKIAAWSLALVAATYLLGTVVSVLRVVGTERVNRRTQISLSSSEIELKLTLPKGMWRVGFAESYQNVRGSFEVVGEHSRPSNSDSEGVTFHTEKDYTKVLVRGKFEGDFNGKFLEIRATF